MTQTGSAAGDTLPTNPTTDPHADSAPSVDSAPDSHTAPLTRRALRAAEAQAAQALAAEAAAARRPKALVQRTDRSAVRSVTGAQTPAPRPVAVAPARPASSSLVGRSAAPTPAAAAPPARRASAPSRKRRFTAPLVLVLTAGMFGTMAVPAAFASTQADGSSDLAAAQNTVRSTDSQQLDVSAAAVLADTGRDAYGATSQASLDAAKHAADVAAERAATAAQYASYTGPTATDYLASSASTPTAAAAGSAATSAVAPAANTPFSLPAVVATAKQYIGTPYVFGGATPAGFDCSGYVMFVYAQYGIQLAHSVPLQDQAGTTIPTSEAQPGDVVIFNNEAHDGFYMGNGMIMDAPKPGGAISIRQIWTSDYHIVRFGV